MVESGTSWVRSNYNWPLFERKPGIYNFSHFDSYGDLYKPNNMHVLPILCDRPSYVRSLDENTAIQKFEEFAREFFTHYQDLGYIEFENEPDLGNFNDTSFIKRMIVAKRVLKSVNSSVKLVHGGLFGKMDYFDRNMEFPGAVDSFDIMAIHPYKNHFINFGQMRAQKAKVENWPKHIKEKYGRDVPLWVTEIGMATPKLDWFDYCRWILNVSSNILFDGKIPNIAMFFDAKFSSDNPKTDFPFEVIPSTLTAAFGKKVKQFDLRTIKDLKAEEYPILFLPFGEMFPVNIFNDIFTYVKNGGTIYVNQGYLFYYRWFWNETSKKCVSSNFNMQGNISKEWKFYIDHADWSSVFHPIPADISRYETNGKKNAEYPTTAYHYSGDKHHSISRFVKPSNQVEGDEFIPLVACNGSDYIGAAIIRPHSKYKGNIVVSTMDILPNYLGHRTLDEQARSVPLQHFILFHSGVEKVFWYKFRGRKNDFSSNNPEEYYGLTNLDLTPKKSFFAYKTMIRAMPPNSVMDRDLDFANNEEWGIFHWKRNDGLDGWCLWSFSDHPKYLYIEGEIHDSFDLVGEPLNLDYGSSLTLTWDPIYIIGPTKVNVSNIPPPSRTPSLSPSESTLNTIKPTISDENSEGKDNKGHTKVIIGVVVAVIVILLIIAAVVAFILIKKRSSKKYETEVPEVVLV